MNTITKAYLASLITNKMGGTKKQSKKMVDAFFDDLSRVILDKYNKSKILLSGFGAFKLRNKSARLGRNPQTGEAMTLSARTVVIFRPTVSMRAAVNGGPSGRIPSAESLYPGTKEAEAKRAARIILGAIKDGLINGDRVEIRGFGTFGVKSYKGYTGRNPKNGDNIVVSPKKLPFFKPSPALLWRVNL